MLLKEEQQRGEGNTEEGTGKIREDGVITMNLLLLLHP